MAAFYELSCRCGWKMDVCLGGSSFTRDACSDIENELKRTPHPKAVQMWKDLLNSRLLQLEKQRPDRQGFYLPSFLQNRKGREMKSSSRPYVYSGRTIGFCPDCNTIDSYLQVVSGQNEQQKPLHPSICSHCGNVVQLLSLHEVPCPRCSRLASWVQTGIE